MIDFFVAVYAVMIGIILVIAAIAIPFLALAWVLVKICESIFDI